MFKGLEKRIFSNSAEKSVINQLLSITIDCPGKNVSYVIIYNYI